MIPVAEIQEAIKSKKTVVGYRKSIRYLKLNSPKIIVMAKNIPEDFRKEIKQDAKLSNSVVEIFEGTSKELGIVCGRPFPVSTVVIK